VQSLTFTGGGSNRTAQEIEAGRAGCVGTGGAAAAGNPGAAGAGDGRFEIRCRRQQTLALLVSSLNSGDLSGAQQAYATLGQLQNGGPARANPSGPFAQAMNQIGEALQSGDLVAAQQALSSMRRPRGENRQP
jgi:hypothetical protein